MTSTTSQTNILNDEFNDMLCKLDLDKLHILRNKCTIKINSYGINFDDEVPHDTSDNVKSILKSAHIVDYTEIEHDTPDDGKFDEIIYGIKLSDNIILYIGHGAMHFTSYDMPYTSYGIMSFSLDNYDDRSIIATSYDRGCGNDLSRNIDNINSVFQSLMDELLIIPDDLCNLLLILWESVSFDLDSNDIEECSSYIDDSVVGKYKNDEIGFKFNYEYRESWGY